MRVRGLFQGLYGPDLIGGIGKGDPRFHRAIFEDANVDPRTAIVVDDGPAVLARAAALGATTVLVRNTPDDRAHHVIDSLSELPGLIDRIVL
jgi:FMN phosphatase YigB (HAD superfamily)